MTADTERRLRAMRHERLVEFANRLARLRKLDRISLEERQQLTTALAILRERHDRSGQQNGRARRRAEWRRRKHERRKEQ